MVKSMPPAPAPRGELSTPTFSDSLLRGEKTPSSSGADAYSRIMLQTDKEKGLPVAVSRRPSPSATTEVVLFLEAVG